MLSGDFVSYSELCQRTCPCFSDSLIKVIKKKLKFFECRKTFEKLWYHQRKKMVCLFFSQQKREGKTDGSRHEQQERRSPESGGKTGVKGRRELPLEIARCGVGWNIYMTELGGFIWVWKIDEISKELPGSIHSHKTRIKLFRDYNPVKTDQAWTSPAHCPL